MWDFIVKSFDVFVFITVLCAWFFLALSLVKATLADRPQNKKDRAYQARTKTKLFIGAILWLTVGILRLCMGFISWGYFVIAVGLLWTWYVFYKAEKELK